LSTGKDLLAFVRVSCFTVLSLGGPEYESRNFLRKVDNMLLMETASYLEALGQCCHDAMRHSSCIIIIYLSGQLSYMRERNGTCRVQVGQKFMKFYLENLKGESIWKEKYGN
jgi:hypothetical protein